MAWYWALIEISANVFEAIIMILVINRLFSWKSKIIYRKTFMAISILVFSAWLTCHTFFIMPMPDFTSGLVIPFLFTILYKRAKIRIALLWVCVNMALFSAVVYGYTALLLSTGLMTMDDIVSLTSYRMFFVVTANLFAWVILWHVPKIVKLRTQQNIKLNIFMFLFNAVVVLIVLFVLYVCIEHSNISPIITAIMGGAGLFFCTYVMWAINHEIEILIEKKDSETIANLLHQELQLAKSSESNEKISIKKMHGHNTQIQVIKSLSQNGYADDARLYAQEYLDDIHMSMFEVETDYKYIDGLLYEKWNRAKTIKCVMTFDVSLPAEMRFEKNDMAGLVGELVDNALDSCERVKCRSPKERTYIDVHISKQKENLLIRIENDSIGIIIKDGNKYVSRKEDSTRHGHGIEIIDEYVEKYNGVCTRYDNNSRFYCEIYLPLAEDKIIPPRHKSMEM